MLPLVRSFDGEERFEALFQAWAQSAHTLRLQGGWDARGLGRYSILGLDPYQVISATGESVYRTSSRGSSQTNGDPFALLDVEYQALSRRPKLPECSVPFQGGAIGFLGYGLRHFVERVPARIQADLLLPDMYFAFFDVVCVYDHLTDRGHVFSSGLPEEGGKAARRARRRLDEVWRWLSDAAPARRRNGVKGGSGDTSEVFADLHTSMEKEEYIRAVERAKAYIQAGDIYQVNLSQRFDVSFPHSAGTLFDALRSVNPSPFGAYLNGPDWTVLSVSPERFFRYDERCVETRPIKGTRPRGKSAEEDEQLQRELQASEKDRAEHVMIVDLERNDLGRFCEYSSVRVPELMVCEAHPTVWHLVSTVSGVPRPGVSLIEGVRAAFPGGSITGAPKVRAMEIIDELETVARGVYTGSIGYLALGGGIDLNIAIRTLSLTRGRAYFHVGGAIVADSDPYSEYQETLDKGLGIARALALAGRDHARREGDGT